MARTAGLFVIPFMIYVVYTLYAESNVTKSFSRRSSSLVEIHDNKSKNQPSVLLVMSDSRTLATEGYHKLAYIINSHYAKLHGYDIQFIHTPCLSHPETIPKSQVGLDHIKNKTCIACHHPQLGPRASPWCKVLAINRTMHDRAKNYSKIVYLDSDSFVNRLNESLPDRYFQNDNNATLNMFANPGERVPCSGIQLWQNTARARRMIQDWWDSDGSKYHLVHDYEQSVFHMRSKLLVEHHNEVGVVRERVREFSKESDGFFRHITKKGPGDLERNRRMLNFIQANGIRQDIL